MKMESLKIKPIDRLESGYQEFDRVLGGGLVPGSIVLIGGDPGIGKSTLLLQSGTKIAANKLVLYVSAEESAQQVRLRWQRLEGENSKLQLLAETDLDLVIQELETLQPNVAIIDSIQALNDDNLSSTPGSVASTPPNFIAPFSGDSITVSPRAPIEILPLLISPIFPALFVFNTI